PTSVLWKDAACGVADRTRLCESRGEGFNSPRAAFGPEVRGQNSEDRSRSRTGFSDLWPLSSDLCLRGMLLGEHAVSKAASQGSNPCPSARLNPCRCGATPERHRARTSAH